MPKSESHADQDLLHAAASGDKQAFGILYEKYSKHIFRYAYYRLGDRTDAEDMTERVFLRLWENLPRDIQREGIQNVRAWLYRVVHNLIVDYYRSRKIEQPIDLYEDNLQGESSAHDAIEKEHKTREMITAIQRLDEKSQHVIILRFIEGLSHKETAKEVGISEGHVRMIQFRALKKMKDLLGSDDE